jgi:hypothetical protein
MDVDLAHSGLDHSPGQLDGLPPGLPAVPVACFLGLLAEIEGGAGFPRGDEVEGVARKPVVGFNGLASPSFTERVVQLSSRCADQDLARFVTAGRAKEQKVATSLPASSFGVYFPAYRQ